MYYGSDESRAAAMKATAKGYRAAAGLFPAIRKVLEQYDGKVFNCRLEKSLHEETGLWVHAKKEYNRLEIYYYGSTYCGNTHFTLATVPLSSLPDGKRIPAALLIQSARDRRVEHLQHAACLEEFAESASTIKEQIDYFLAQANRIAGNLPAEVRDVYDIKYRYG